MERLTFRAAVRASPEELASADGRMVPDLVAPDLDVLFCGINPGLTSGATATHFAGPGNRFWKVLHLSGFTPLVLAPTDQDQLLSYGLGITNLSSRTTATAAELTKEELRSGAVLLTHKVAQLRPRYVAFLGMQSYRTAFRRPRATVGPQPEQVADAKAWLLPNPSGLQARYQLPELVDLYGALRQAVGRG